MNERCRPMLAVRGEPFDSAEYLFEVKLYDRFYPLDQYPGQGGFCGSREEILLVK
jgi:hypothetical protein